MVHYEKEANEYGVVNSALVPVLTKGMQEQQMQVEELKSKKNEMLEKQIKELKYLIKK